MGDMSEGLFQPAYFCLTCCLASACSAACNASQHTLIARSRRDERRRPAKIVARARRGRRSVVCARAQKERERARLAHRHRNAARRSRETRCRKIEHKLQFIISICRAAAQVSLSEHFCVAFLRSNVRAQNHSFSRHGANHFFSRRAFCASTIGGCNTRAAKRRQKCGCDLRRRCYCRCRCCCCRLRRQSPAVQRKASMRRVKASMVPIISLSTAV